MYNKTMVASVKSVDTVLQIVLKYVPKDKLPDLIAELKTVPGNRSFMETMQLLEKRSAKND